MQVVSLNEKFAQFKDYWSPKIVGELNGQHVKLAKVQGEFVWHAHQDEDELFFVVKGTLDIEFRDQTVTLSEGEMLVVPRGVEHNPVAREEVWLMLFEPAEIKHTGEVESEHTVKEYERL
jgi:mannose-6-phosphate isomerase-like protein (cupin superfamily)